MVAHTIRISKLNASKASRAMIHIESRLIYSPFERRHFSRTRARGQLVVTRFSILLLALLAGACAAPKPEPERPPVTSAPAPVAHAPLIPPPVAEPAPPAAEPAPPAESTSAMPLPALVPVAWGELPNWAADDHAAALKAFVHGCAALAAREAWRSVCQQARALSPSGAAAARQFFESRFRPYRALDDTGADEGLITGYYEPLLRGSRSASARYRYPLYGVPDDLLVIDLGELYPNLKGERVRGRLEGRRVVPYFSRAQIERGEAPLSGKALFWVDDPIELFFLQIQGSGQLRLENGEHVRIGFADQNGHPYRSIGRLLIERGELTFEQASMQGIKGWAQRNPERLNEVLHHNARYVFFRELPAGLPGPLGALGVPLSAGRSLAVDPRYIPLGAPVYLATTWPNSKRPLQRLLMAQDTGGAIRGGVRGDFFWGYGAAAGVQAGGMRQAGRMWVMLPIGVSPDALLPR